MGAGPDRLHRFIFKQMIAPYGRCPPQGESRFFWFVFFAALQRK
jgi:hypothetical protein